MSFFVLNKIKDIIYSYEIEGKITEEEAISYIQSIENYKRETLKELHKTLFYLMQHLHQPFSDLLKMTIAEKELYAHLVLEQLEEQKKAMEEASAISSRQKR